jgi:hypothetical protein
LGTDHARSLSPRLPAALFLLGILSAAFDVGCVLVKTPFLRPGVTAGDAIETAGVFVVLALFARVAGLAAGGGAGAAGAMLGIAAAAFAFGHGIHVAANSLHDLAARNGAGDPTGLLDFWDEHAGHYLVDGARVLFAAALTLGSARAGAAGAGGDGREGVAAVIAGGAALGFTLFASAVEGQTVPLVLPFSAVYAAWGTLSPSRGAAARGAGPAPGRLVRLFFTAAAWTALLFFAIWGVWQGGFPEFTRAGILHSAP